MADMSSNTSEYNRTYAIKRRKVLVKKGICVRCSTQEATKGSTSCAVCREYDRRAKRRARAKKLEVLATEPVPAAQ